MQGEPISACKEDHGRWFCRAGGAVVLGDEDPVCRLRLSLALQAAGVPPGRISEAERPQEVLAATALAASGQGPEELVGASPPPLLVILDGGLGGCAAHVLRQSFRGRYRGSTAAGIPFLVRVAETPAPSGWDDFACSLPANYDAGDIHRVLDACHSRWLEGTSTASSPSRVSTASLSEFDALGDAGASGADLEAWRQQRVAKRQQRASSCAYGRQIRGVVEARRDGPSLQFLTDMLEKVWPGRCICRTRRLIGMGRTGHVFLGEWRSDANGANDANDADGSTGFTPVAVKISRNLPDDQLTALCFARELDIGLRFDHLNVCKALAGSQTHPLMLIQEYCAGGSVEQLLRGARSGAAEVPTMAQRLKIALDVARGMTCLHEASPQVVHRDLKPDNVMIASPIATPEDVPLAKIVDFGLARCLSHGEATAMTRLVGSLRWMAPEAMGEGNCDARVDIYSFALCFFELLTLQTPYGEDERQLPQRLEIFVTRGGRPDDLAPMTGAPAWAIALIRRTWAQRPEDRPAFREIADELERRVAEL